MNALEALVALLNTPVVAGAANAGQLWNIVENLKQTELLEIMSRFDKQDNEILADIVARLERIENAINKKVS